MKTKITSLTVAIAIIFTLTATDRPPSQPAPEKYARVMQKTGGFIEKPAQGRIVIFNSQSKVDEQKIASRAELLSDVVCGKMDVINFSGPFSIDNAQKAMIDEKANVAFFLIDDSALPMSLVALEGAWGMINMSKVAEGTADAEVIFARYAAEFNRVVRSLLTVGENGRRPAPIGVAKPAPKTGADLDAIKNTMIPLQEATAIHANMASFGIAKATRTTYEKACYEGWAPMPTNDYQKAIWDKVHAIPATPMKIEFDPKKGR